MKCNRKECSKVEIGERIKNLRDSKGLTQAELAKELGDNIRRETVNYWENGERDLKTDYTAKLADYFDVTCDEIICGIKAENVGINKKIGLNDKAIECLQESVSSFNNANGNLFEMHTPETFRKYFPHRFANIIFANDDLGLMSAIMEFLVFEENKNAEITLQIKKGTEQTSTPLTSEDYLNNLLLKIQHKLRLFRDEKIIKAKYFEEEISRELSKKGLAE